MTRQELSTLELLIQEFQLFRKEMKKDIRDLHDKLNTHINNDLKTKQWSISQIIIIAGCILTNGITLFILFSR